MAGSLSVEGACSLERGGGGHLPQNFTRFYCCMGGAYSVEYGNNSLKDKNYSNEIILIEILLKVKGDFFS